MKAEGLKDGVPDICLPVATVNERIPSDGYFGLYIELKIEKRRNQKNGGCSEEQLEWLAYLNGAGYKAVVCYSWIEAVEVIKEYLKCS